MSDLLNQASLVYIPSGYKEDTAYSVIPTDGSGDLTFTRASDGTRVNSAGLVENVPWNLCTYSEDQTQWTSQNATTVTANSTTAPNGTITADTVTPTAVNDDHYRGILLSSQVGELTAFIYVKPNGYNFFDWGIWNGSFYIVRATFDLVNLTYTFTIPGTATIESVGNGWLKCGISGSNASLSTIGLYYRTRPTGGSGFFTGNGTSGAFVWGAQLNTGTTAKPYFPTTDRQNVPRLTYEGGCASLLLEPQRTNLILQSEAFGSASWSAFNASVSSNVSATLDPQGYYGADKLVEDSSSAYHDADQVQTYTAAAYTISVFAKAAGRNHIFLQHFDGSTFFTSGTFNLADGTISGVGTIENYGNGWYRCSYTATTASGTGKSYINLSNGTTGNYQGDGTSGVYIWGAQLEAGSYPTSYIPTTSASVTRVADAAYKTGISSLIGQTEGVLFVDFEHSVTSTTEDTRFILSDNTYNNWTFFSIENGTSLRYYLTSGGVNELDTTVTNVFPTAGRYKVAMAYEDDLFTIYVNGVQKVNNTTSTNIPAMSALLLSGKEAVTTAVELVNKKVNQAVLFPTRLTNDQLAALTTL